MPESKFVPTRRFFPELLDVNVTNTVGVSDRDIIILKSILQLVWGRHMSHKNEIRVVIEELEASSPGVLRGEREDYEIAIDVAQARNCSIKGLSEDMRLVFVVAHEAMHLVQLVRGDILQDSTDSSGELIAGYYDLPEEVEASQEAVDVIAAFFSQDIPGSLRLTIEGRSYVGWTISYTESVRDMIKHINMKKPVRSKL